tara:strand:+ start:108 stop:644 length:537 start_codon:yes stop_codon:yes gene_type:complete
MANLDAPNGFNPIGKMGSGAPQKMNEYDALAAYGTKIYQGDLVKLNAGNVERGAAADTAFVGVFWGANFDDSDGKPKFINNRPASTAAKVFVYDDPYQVFEIQGDAGSAQANIGNTTDINAGGGTDATGVSLMEADSANFGAGKVNLRVIGFSGKEGRGEVGSANALYEVLINEHLYK